MDSAFTLFQSIFENNYFVLAMCIVAFAGKIIIFTALTIRNYVKKVKNHPSIFLLINLLSAAAIDLTWIILLTNRIGFPLLFYKHAVFYCRLGWAFFVLQYHSMLFLLITLITRDYKVLLRKDRIFLCISTFFVLFFIIFSIATWNMFEKGQRPQYEYLMKHACSIYLLLMLMPIGLWRTTRYLNSTRLPRIIRKQYQTLFYFLVIPYYIADFLSMNPLRTDYFALVIQSQAFAGFSALILTYLLYFCMRRILNIRFLSHELPITPRSFTEQFDDQHRDFVSLLEGVTHEYDIVKLVQRFTARILDVDAERVSLSIRSHMLEEPQKELAAPMTPLMHSIEMQLDTCGVNFIAYLAEQRYIFFDDVHFLSFHEQKEERTIALGLLESIGATIFIPLFRKGNLIGYIVVKKNEKGDRLYDRIDRDRLIACAGQTALTIVHLHQKNKAELYEKNRKLASAVSYLDQRLNHLKEIVQAFVQPSKIKQIALFYYKNRVFIPAHKDAEKFIAVNLNTDVGHPLVQACVELVQQAQEHRSTQSALVTGAEGRRLLALTFPHIQERQIVLLITAPDVTDMVMDHIGQLQSFNEWDHLLSLQMTKVGHKLNSFLPGWTKGLVQLKVELFQKIESKQPLFITCDTDDAQLIAHTIHEAAARVHSVAFIDPLAQQGYEIKLFGKTWPYGIMEPEEPLLSALNGGTICILNSHALSAEVQEQLAVYLHEGRFKKIGGKTFCHSDVHLLFTTSYTLCAETPVYVPSLRSFVAQRCIVLPSPTHMEEADITELMDGYGMQAIRTEIKTPLFTLSVFDKRKIINCHPASLTELKSRVFYTLRQKHKEKDETGKIIFDPAFLLVDQTLATAARLGKNALKQKQIMTVLWLAFDKNQSKIAKFLNVERSSVHRRVKEYGLK